MAEAVRARRLTDQEGQRLQQIVRRGKHGSIRVRRAMIIMASASGTPVPAIARLVAADEDTVRDVIHLFNQKGLAALDPQWAGGRPRRISDDDVELIVAAATTRPEKLGLPFTRWSLRKLAGYLARNPAGTVTVGRERLRQILHARQISFQRAAKHKVRLCFTPVNASWANPIEAQFGPLRTFVIGSSDYPSHAVLARRLQAYLRWRNANARHPNVLAAQRRERARIRSERQQRWGRPKPKAA
jgi:transposase